MAQHSSLVTVIVSMYNAEDTAGRTIESILSQTYSKLEILLIDNGSTDQTRTLADHYANKDSRIRVLTLTQFTSHELGWNRGLASAKGVYVAFVLAGEVWKPQKVELQLKSMKRIGVPFYYCAYNVVDQKGTVMKKIVHAPTYLTKDRVLRGFSVELGTALFSLEKLQLPELTEGVNSKERFYLKVLEQCERAGGMDVVLVSQVAEQQHLIAKAKIGLKSFILMNWGLYYEELKMGPVAASYYIAAKIVHRMLHGED